jgi:hypothetical protein
MHNFTGFIAIAVPTVLILFALITLAVFSFSKPPTDPQKKKIKPARPMPRPPAAKQTGQSEQEQRRARRRAKRGL